MDHDSTHRGTALITGAARRLGRQMALELHDAGYDIALHFRDSATDAENLAQDLNKLRTESCTCLLYTSDAADD